MNRAEIIEGLKDIHDRFYAFTGYRKTIESCLELLENENTLIDRVLEIIEKTDAKSDNTSAFDFGITQACSEIREAVLALKGNINDEKRNRN